MCIRDSFYYVRLDATQCSFLSHLFSSFFLWAQACHSLKLLQKMEYDADFNLCKYELVTRLCSILILLRQVEKWHMCISHGVFRSNTHFKGSLSSFQWSDFFPFFFIQPSNTSPSHLQRFQSHLYTSNFPYFPIVLVGRFAVETATPPLTWKLKMC